MAELLPEQLENATRAHIEDLKSQLAEAESYLQDILSRKSKSGLAGMRFYGWDPIEIFRALIKENGGPMKRSEIEKKMIEGGYAVDKKRPAVNIERAFRTNAKFKNITIDGDYIDIPR
jgi:hypothetical protein